MPAANQIEGADEVVILGGEVKVGPGGGAKARAVDIDVRHVLKHLLRRQGRGKAHGGHIEAQSRGIGRLVFVVPHEGIAELEDRGGRERIVVAEKEVAVVGDVLVLLRVGEIVIVIGVAEMQAGEGEAPEDLLLLAEAVVETHVELLGVVRVRALIEIVAGMIFSLMIRLPSRSTLFPYTTLSLPASNPSVGAFTMGNP